MLQKAINLAINLPHTYLGQIDLQWYDLICNFASIPDDFTCS